MGICTKNGDLSIAQTAVSEFLCDGTSAKISLYQLKSGCRFFAIPACFHFIRHFLIVV